jgi:hypothetical protein
MYDMNITLHQTFSISETETGIKNTEIIYPNNQSVLTNNRLFITCGGNSNKSSVAGQVVCDAIQTYFHSFVDDETKMNADFIEKSIRFGEITLDEFQKNNPEMRGISTILCLVYFASGCVYFSQIGESHIYQIRNNRIIYKSIDSSAHRKIQGGVKSVDVNIVKLKDIQEQDQFFIYSGDYNLEDESHICRILSEYASAEDKLSKIKSFYLDKSKSSFSAHLIPIRGVENPNKFKKKLSSLLYSFN